MPPAAREGDPVTGVDTHLVQTPSGSPTALPHPFAGRITSGCSSDVKIAGMPAATVGSTAENQPPHVPTPPGTAFVNAPTNKGQVSKGSATVLINGKPAARQGDQVMTCNDPVPAPTSSISGGATNVVIGG